MKKKLAQAIVQGNFRLARQLRRNLSTVQLRAVGVLVAQIRRQDNERACGRITQNSAASENQW